MLDILGALLVVGLPIGIAVIGNVLYRAYERYRDREQ